MVAAAAFGAARAKMGLTRVVSVVHPAQAVGEDRRFVLLDGVEATLVLPAGLGQQGPDGVRRVFAAVRGRGRGTRFPTLATALELLSPDVVHLQANPETRLAAQVAGLSRRGARFGLVLECGDFGSAGAAVPLLAHHRLRRALGLAQAAMIPSAAHLARLRRCGFRGTGVVVGRHLPVASLPSREEARWQLHIDRADAFVVGFVCTRRRQRDLHGLMRALRFCPDNIVLVVAAERAVAHELAVHADALELLERVRIVDMSAASGGTPESTLGAVPGPILAGADAVVAPGGGSAPERAANKLVAETCLLHGVPVAHDRGAGLGDLVGAGGWAIPPSDPALLAQLLTLLAGRPDLVQQAHRVAAQDAAIRHSLQATAEGLSRAIAAAASQRDAALGEMTLSPGRQRRRFSLGREPSRT